MKLFSLLLLISSFNSYAISFVGQRKKNCNEKVKSNQVLTCADYQKLNELTQTKPFKKIAVLGASVSDNYGGVESPGDRVAKSLKGNLFKHAKPHQSSHQVLAQRAEYESKLKESDLIIAVDLFFWNSVKRFWPNGECSEDKVKKQIDVLKGSTGKLILGEVPILRSSQDSSCVKKINDVINTSCTKDDDCLVLKEDEILPPDGNTEELFQSDGLHLSNKGAQYMSDKICEHLYLSSN